MGLWFAAIGIGFVLGYLTPWWVIAIVWFGFGYSQAEKNKLEVLGKSFIGSGLTWLIPAIFIYVNSSSSLVANLASLLPGQASWMIFAITFVVVGLVSTFAGLSGYLLKQALEDSE